MMVATEIRHLAHVCTSYILFCDQICFYNVDFNPINLTYMVNLKGNEIICI